MDDNETFIAKWKLIRDKTLLKYVISDALKGLLVAIPATIIILWISPPSSSISGLVAGKRSMDVLIISNAFLFFIYIVARIRRWFNSERRYNKIVNKELKD